MIGITNGNGGSAGAANNVVRKNLLDNWYFGSTYRELYPINQRFNGSYVSTNEPVYCFDRWMINNGSVELDYSSIVIRASSDANSGATEFAQILQDVPFAVSSTTLTFSVLTADSELYTETVEFDGTSDVGIYGDGWSFIIKAEVPVVIFSVGASAMDGDGCVYIQALKVEIGDTQTLAYQKNGAWYVNEIPNPQEELFKCQTAVADPEDPYANQENTVGLQVRPNLIDNWYFVGGGSQQGDGYFPINQRAKTIYTTNYEPVIDRWRISGSPQSLTINSDCITLLGSASVYYSYMRQNIEHPERLNGKTVTLSILCKGSGGVQIKLYNFTKSTQVGGQGIYFTSPAYRIYSYTTTIPDNAIDVGDVVTFTVYPNDLSHMGTSLDIKAVKLEIGSNQTLAYRISASNYILNEIPDYEEQLFRCQTSTADPTDTYANQPNLVGFQVRPNLLDNWYFVGGGSQLGDGTFPINQRASTSYSNITYSVDRWKIANATIAVEPNASGLIMTSTSGMPSGYRLFEQYQNFNMLAGQTYTISLLVTSVSGSYRLIFGSQGTSSNRIRSGDFSSDGLITATGTFSSDCTDPFFGIGSATSGETSIKIIAAKLELGDTQTLAHKENGVWVVNEIPDFQEELYRCKMSTADTSDTYANNKNGFLPMSGGRLTGRLYTDSGITMSTGFTSNGLGTVDLTANTYTAGANGHVLAAKFKSEDGSQTHTTYPISIIGTSNTTSNYNSGVRLGSINGTTIVSAGESGSTFAAANAKFDDENLYLVADGQVLLYKAANDGTVSLGPLVVAGFGATPTSGQVVVTSGTAGDIRSSGYAVNSSGGIPSYQYSTTDLTAGTSSLTTGRLYFVYE